MADIFLERDLEPAMSIADVLAVSSEGAGCLQLHRVAWHGSLLAHDGRRLVCHFRAADAESARIALRSGGADIRRLWPGTIHDAPNLGRFDADSANVMVRRAFAQAVALEDIQAREDAGAWCLAARQVKFVRSYFSLDRRRMLCLYRAPDAESVREAQRQAYMPVEDVWAFTALLPTASGQAP
jgi:hypothetical protein